jgi:hypothetical protein
MWIHDFLPELAAFTAVALWSLLSAPLLIRLLGVPISINPIKRGKLKWDLRQSLLIGVVVFGVGMILFGVTYKYFTWKLTGNPSDQLTLLGFRGLVLKWSLGGVFFGLLMRLTNGNQSGDQASPNS